MKRLNFRYLSFSISFILLVLSCGHEVGLREQLYDYLKSKHKFVLTPNIKNIIVLTESNCINCNKEFNNSIFNNLGEINFENTLLIINASGAKIDISAYQQGNDKIIFDNLPYSTDFPFLNNSTYIKLGADKNVDTVIEINSDAIEAKLDFITKQLK